MKVLCCGNEKLKIFPKKNCDADFVASPVQIGSLVRRIETFFVQGKIRNFRFFFWSCKKFLSSWFFL